MPRLPSSLKWLIDRRARVAGEIEKIEALLSKCRRLADELDTLRQLLSSIDQTLALHDAAVDVSLIQTVRSHDVRINLPHGELTRGILMCLKLHEGKPVSTDAVTAFIAARYADLDVTPSSATELRESVRYRLKNLGRQRLVTRLRLAGGDRKGVWTLASQEAENTS